MEAATIALTKLPPLRSIFDALPNPILVVDENNVICFANSAASSLAPNAARRFGKSLGRRLSDSPTKADRTVSIDVHSDIEGSTRRDNKTAASTPCRTRRGVGLSVDRPSKVTNGMSVRPSQIMARK